LPVLADIKYTIWLIIGIIFFFNQEPLAGQIYTWTDKNGTLHLTDTLLPKSAEKVDVMRYTPRSGKDLGAVQQIQNYEKYNRLLKEAEDLVDRTTKQAAEARNKANIAEESAQEEQAKTIEQEAKVTRRRKQKLELIRQKAREVKAIEKSAEAQQQALNAEKLKQQAEEQLKTLRQVIDQQRKSN